MKITFKDTSANQYDLNADEVKYSSDKTLGKLYIGDRDCANFLQLRSRKCLTVVNCAADMHGLSGEKDVKYLNVDPDITDCFEDSYTFIEKALTKGKNVTVHCQNGLGKSAAIILYAVMRLTSCTLADSHRLLKKCRKNHDLNIRPDLVAKLIAAEKKQRKSTSICLDGRKIVYLDSIFSDRKRTSKSGGGFPFVPCVVFIAFVAILYGSLLFATGKL